MRVWRARFNGEFWAIDVVSAETRQFDAIACFGRGAARLRVLAGKSADARDALPRSMHEHKRHLQQNLEFRSDRGGRTIRETLGTISAPKNETFAACGLGELRFQRFDFITRHQRRKRRDLLERAEERRLVGVDGLLRTRLALPTARGPLHRESVSAGVMGAPEERWEGAPHVMHAKARAPRHLSPPRFTPRGPTRASESEASRERSNHVASAPKCGRQGSNLHGCYPTGT